MIMHDSSILGRFHLKYLAASCIYISLKIIEQIIDNSKTKVYVNKLKALLSLKEQTFYFCSEGLLNLAKNFEGKFSFCKNLLKFDSFCLG